MRELRDHVRSAAARPEVPEAVGRVYADLQQAIDQRRPVCQVSGRCCRFEEYGHRLYVTTLELAAFVASLEPRSDQPDGGWDGTGCPFQAGGLCGVHAIRPFGCRIYFCDATAQHWQEEQYERFHARLKALHEQLGVAYFYVEWRSALAALELADASAGDQRAGLTVKTALPVLTRRPAG